MRVAFCEDAGQVIGKGAAAYKMEDKGNFHPEQQLLSVRDISFCLYSYVVYVWLANFTPGNEKNCFANKNKWVWLDQN